MFNKNAYWFGILLGIAAPLLVFIILYGALQLYHELAVAQDLIDTSNLQLLSTVVNLFFIRYYFVSKKYEDTGRGILLVTFIYVIAFFIINGILF